MSECGDVAGDHRFESVVIRKVKRPQGFARWSAYVVDDDDHGLWLYSPPGTLFRSQMGGAIGENEVGRGSGDAGLPVMHLMPVSAWWMATWWCSDGENCKIGVDICRPPALIDDEWTFIDLEIDFVLHADGRLVIQDEDEFEEACQAGWIPGDEASQARSAAATIERCLCQRTEPFGRHGWNKLDEAMRLSLPPIKELRQVAR